MNDQDNIEEFDSKPFALCPLCLRRLHNYLNIEGSEIVRMSELRSKFIKIDPNNFSKELDLFSKIVNKKELLVANKKFF